MKAKKPPSKTSRPKSPQHRAVLNLIRAVHKLSEQVQGLRKSIERPPVVVGGSLPAEWRPGPVGYVDTVPAGVGAKEWLDSQGYKCETHHWHNYQPCPSCIAAAAQDVQISDAELQRALEERISAQMREG